MSESVNIDTASRVPQEYKVVTSSGQEVQVNVNQLVFTQRQTRPKSIKTARLGNVYVTPTGWTHFGAVHNPPVTSGACKPWNLTSTAHWDYLYGGPGIDGYRPTIPQTASADMNRLVQAATTDCLLRLKSQKVNLGVSLAEAKEVAEMVATTARRVGNIYQGAYNRRPKEWLAGVRNAGRNWKKVPAYYLEYVYGVAPLLSDVDGACAALAETYNRGNKPYITAYSVRRDSLDYTELLSSLDGQYGRLRGNGTEQQIARVGATCDVPNWVMQDYSSLGITNPFSIAWEKVPYSHVVDWFLPVGDWINTWDVGNYLRFKSGYTTRFITRTGRSVYEAPAGATTTGVREDLMGSFRSFRMERTPFVSLPNASFPSLRNPLSLDHMAQGLAMLTQVISGHKRLASRGSL